MLFQIIGDLLVEFFVFVRFLLGKRGTRILLVAGQFVLFASEAFLRGLPVSRTHGGRFLLIVGYFALECCASALQVSLCFLGFLFEAGAYFLEVLVVFKQRVRVDVYNLLGNGRRAYRIATCRWGCSVLGCWC